MSALSQDGLKDFNSSPKDQQLSFLTFNTIIFTVGLFNFSHLK